MSLGLVKSGILEDVYKMGVNLRVDALKQFEIEYKKNDDPVTYLDRWAESSIISDLKKRFGTDLNIVGEEYGQQDNGGDLTAFIDPIDGTKSFIRRDFECCTALTLESSSGLELSLVNDFMKGIMYVAADEKVNVYLDGTQFDEFRPANLPKPRIVISDDVENFKEFIESNPEIDYKKLYGSTVLHMARMAVGDFSGIIAKDGIGGIWDYAAGHHILQCAGMKVYRIDGTELRTIHDYKIRGERGRVYLAVDGGVDKEFDIHRKLLGDN